MLAGPIPINSKPLVYKKSGIKVINPAQNKWKDKTGLLNEKILIFFSIKKKNKIIAIGEINKVSISKPMSVETLICFLT